MAGTVDEYGRAPEYATPTAPGSPTLRAKMFGKILAYRPRPVPGPAFVNDQQEA